MKNILRKLSLSMKNIFCISHFVSKRFWGVCR